MGGHTRRCGYATAPRAFGDESALKARFKRPPPRDDYKPPAAAVEISREIASFD